MSAEQIGIDPAFRELQTAMENIQPGQTLEFDRPIVLSDKGFVYGPQVVADRKGTGAFAMNLKPGDKVVFVDDVQDTNGAVYMTRWLINGVPYRFNAPREFLLSENFVDTVVETDTRPVPNGRPNETEEFRSAIYSTVKEAVN